ncbi:MAG: crossover junction endodeoxyribonuclease RuvC [Chitinophagaceae bacterium]|nr:MAG: crossover junction endodeoxyribonuclease RuvC [Chitinophagaceae bacterium]
MEKPAKIILGIDPGTVVMGYGIIAVTGGKPVLLEMSILKLSAKLDQYQRLEAIHFKVTELISRFHPDCFAIEAPFFGKNVQSMLKLGRAQGVAIAAAISAGLEVSEYSPKKVKQSITGNGNADKDQVWKMLQHIMQLQNAELKYLDSSDALAVAVCHHFQDNPLMKKNNNRIKSWEDFATKNPDRVR